MLQTAGGTMTAALLALAVAFGSTADDDKDTIQLKNGTSQTGKITSQDYAGLKYANAKKQETVLKWEEVASVQLCNALDLYAARDAIDAGKADDAQVRLEKLLADKKLRPVVRQEALFQLARAQQRRGQHDAAVAAYREITKSFPNGNHLFAIGNGLTGLFLARNDTGGAERSLDEVVSAATQASVDPGYLSGFDFLRGRIAEAKKKNPEAQAAYEKVLNAKNAPADAVALAKLGVARLLQLGGKKTDAEQRYRDLIKQLPSSAVMAGAWNGLGDLALEDGSQRKNLDRITEALQLYLHGIVVDVPPAGEPTDEYERALAGSATCLREIGNLEGNADQKKAYLERARQRFEQLKVQFPSSRYLPK